MIRVLFALTLLGAVAGVLADALLALPEAWRGRLAALPAQRVADIDPFSAKRIHDTRVRVHDLLSDAAATPRELAAAYGRLGALYASERLYAGAELSLGNARRLDAEDFRWAYLAAHIALEQGEAEQALVQLAAATQIDPDYAPLALRRGQALLDLNRLDAARSAFDAAAATPGLRAAARYGLGQIALLQRDWQTAVSNFRAVLTLQPQADAVHYPLSQALIRVGRRDDAREHLARRGTIKPTFDDALIDELRALQSGPKHHYKRGVAASRRQDYAAAADAFAAGLADDPDNARARTSYARALWLSDRAADARQELERAIVADPAMTLPRFLLAVIDDAGGDRAPAAAGYAQVLDLEPEHAGALGYLANLELRRGEPSAAARYFRRAIDAGVTEMQLFLHYWGALLQAGTADAELRDRLIAFDKRFPEPPLFRALLARLLAVSTDPEVSDRRQALEIAEALHASAPGVSNADLLALALAATGDFTRAEALQRELVETARFGGAWAWAESFEQVAQDYAERRLPTTPWSSSRALLRPAPADPDRVMRNYPAAQPY